MGPGSPHCGGWSTHITGGGRNEGAELLWELQQRKGGRARHWSIESAWPQPKVPQTSCCAPPPNQRLPTSILASPPSSPPARALFPHLSRPLSPMLSPLGSPMARLLVGKELSPWGHPAQWQAGGGASGTAGKWQRGRPRPVPLPPPASYRVVPATHKRPAAALPCQLAASPAWHLVPARSCLHTPPTGPSPKPQRARHPPRTLRQKAQPDPSPCRNFADDAADTKSDPAQKRFALTPMTDLSPIAGLMAPNTPLRRGRAARSQPGRWVFGRRARRRLLALYLCQAGGSKTLLVPAVHGWTPWVPVALGRADGG